MHVKSMGALMPSISITLTLDLPARNWSKLKAVVLCTSTQYVSVLGAHCFMIGVHRLHDVLRRSDSHVGE